MMTSLKTDCRKFAPNIFNKTKCQNCFRGKNVHSTEALESNRATRKVCLCGYLFVAPDWDFSLTANRNKRWQRRWFVLYNDGELVFSVDECPETVPQAVIDMNCALEVADAEAVTGNPFSLALTLPEKIHFIKGRNKDEINRWLEALSRFPKNTICGKYKRNATFPGIKGIPVPKSDNNFTDWVSNKENTDFVDYLKNNSCSQSTNNVKNQNSRSALEQGDFFPTKDISSTQKDKSQVIDVHQKSSGTERKLFTKEVYFTSDTEDLQSNVDQRTKGRLCLDTKCAFRNEIPDTVTPCKDTENYSRSKLNNSRRRHSRSDVSHMIPSLMKESQAKSENYSADSNLTSGGRENYHNPLYVLMSDVPSGRKIDTCENLFKSGKLNFVSEENHAQLESEKSKVCNIPRAEIQKSASVPNAVKFLENGKLQSTEIAIDSRNAAKRENCDFNLNSMKCIADNISLVRGDPDGGNLEISPSSCNTYGSHLNRMNDNFEIFFLKKGWLVKQENNKWNKHWFVLRNSALTFYSDPIAEDAGILDGVIDLRKVQNVSEVQSNSGFTFCLLMKDDSKVYLSAITSKLRNNWMQAILQASNLKDMLNREVLKKTHSTGSLKCHASNTFLNAHDVNSSSKVANKHYSSNVIPKVEKACKQMQSRHSSVPLPPSPPLARTAISRVKEKTRSRLHSRCKIKFNSDAHTFEQKGDINDSDEGATDHSSSSLPTAVAEFLNSQSYFENADEEHQALCKDKNSVLEVKDQLEDQSWSIWLDISQFCREVEEKLDSMQTEKVILNCIHKHNSHDSKFCPECTIKSVDYNKIIASLNNIEEKLCRVHNELEQSKTSLMLSSNNNNAKSLFNKNFEPQLLKQEINVNNLCSQNVLLTQQLNRIKQENQKLKKELKMTQNSSDDFELYCMSLKQEMQSHNNLYQSNMSLMVARVEDLTNKFLNSEKNVRQLKQKIQKLEQKQERRRSSLKGKEAITLSKEYEAKLLELEQKIDAIEVTFKAPENNSSEMNSSNMEENVSKDASLIMRLHNLDKKVKNASSTVDQTFDECDMQRLTKPEIRLQIKLDDDSIVHGMDSFEDWNSLSVSTSVTDFSKLDDSDVQEAPNEISFPQCLSDFEKKLNSFISWLKAILEYLARNTSSSDQYTKNFFSNTKTQEELCRLINVFDSIVNAIESSNDVHNASNIVKKLLAKLAFLQEMSNVLFKYSDLDLYKNIILIHHLVRVKQALLGTEKYIIQRNACASDAKSANVSLCGVIFSLFFGSPNFENVSESKEFVSIYQEVISIKQRVSLALSEFKKNAIENFSTTLNALLMDPIEESLSSISPSQESNESTIGQKQFLSHITQIMRQVSETFIYYVSKSLKEICFEEADVHCTKEWTSLVSKLLQEELNVLYVDIKNSCSKHLENNFFSNSKCGVLIEYVYCSVWELAQLASICTVIETMLVLVKDAIHFNPFEDTFYSFFAIESKNVNNDSLDLICKNLYHKILNIMFKLPNTNCTALWKLCNKYEENVSQKSVSSLLCFKQKYKFVLEKEQQMYKTQLNEINEKLKALQKEQKNCVNESCKTCTELKQEVCYLQAELDESRTLANSGSFCEKCAALKQEIQKLMEQHERHSFLIQRFEEQEEKWKMCVQDALLEKENIFQEERQKLENEIQTLKEILSNIEKTYDNGVQNLQNLYEQKIVQKEKYIEEEVFKCHSTELNELKLFCRNGIEAVENSYKKIVHELEQRHKKELDNLMAEKEKLLAEEACATAVALEAVRKAHKEELQRQVQNFKEEFLQKMKSRFETEALKKNCELDICKTKNEILSITEKYSQKCIENAALKENFDFIAKQLKAVSSQVIELQAKNKQLQAHLASEIIQKQEEHL